MNECAFVDVHLQVKNRVFRIIPAGNKDDLGVGVRLGLTDSDPLHSCGKG